MLIVIVGGDANERAERRRELVRLPLQELDAARISVDELAAMAATQTLTGETLAFFVRGALSVEASAEEREEFSPAEDLGEALLEIAGGLATSPHSFVFEEEKLPIKTVRSLEAAGAKLEALEKKKKEEEEFNIFGLADALGKRDRKILWLLLVQALRQGIAPENIAGVLAWKARTMLSSARTPADRDRLRKLSFEIVSMYHDAHRGAGDLGLLLERFALTL